MIVVGRSGSDVVIAERAIGGVEIPCRREENLDPSGRRSVRKRAVNGEDTDMGIVGGTRSIVDAVSTDIGTIIGVSESMVVIDGAESVAETPLGSGMIGTYDFWIQSNGTKDDVNVD